VLTAALGLGASLAWGVSDFVGPLKGRTLGALRVLLTAQLGGLAAIGVAIAVRGAGPAGAAVFLAIPAALSGTIGLYAYYRGMAVGAMTIVAPVAGVSAAVPVVVGIATGDRPSLLQGVGIGVALAGVGLASREHQEGSGRRLAAGAGLALFAAVGFGGYFVPMHAAGAADFWWASFLFRLTATVLVGLAVLGRREPVGLSASDAVVVAAVGVGDTLGNFLYAAASSRGVVSVVSVLASLYPVVTVMLARVALGERVDRLQQLGVASTLVGVVLISNG
jgi:drug/metabolite transporter (DMT)-like permease